MPTTAAVLLMRSGSHLFASVTHLQANPRRYRRRGSGCSSQLKDRLDFDRRISRQRTKTDSAASANSVVIAPDFCPKLAAAVDHFRMIVKVGRGVDHAERFYDALDPVEAAQVGSQGSQNGHAGCFGRLLAVIL